MARDTRLRVPGAAVLLFALFSSGAAAEPASRADAEHDFLAALARAPHVSALQQRRAALARLEGAAGRLPDPMLSLGYARKRTPMETMPMYDVMLEQALPRWGSRDAARAAAAASTRMGEAELAGEVALLASEVASALAELDGLRARLVEGEAEERRIAALATQIDARIASGDAGALERLALETRRERLRLRQDDVRRQLDDRQAEVRGRLGLGADAPLPPFAAPAPDAIDAARSPTALAAEAVRQEALAALLEARAQGRPETAIGVRAEREDGMEEEDTIGLTFSIGLPLARGAIAAHEEAAQARVRAAERSAEAARWRTQSAVAAARRALVLAERSASLSASLLVRAEAENRALAGALGFGGAGLTALLDLHDSLAELRLDAIAAQTSARQALAGLWLQTVPNLPTTAEAKP